MRRFLFSFLSTALLLCTLAGCADKTDLDPDDPVTLTMWHVYGSQTESPLNDIIEEFNQTEGAGQGIIIDVTSVTNSADIDEALIAAAGGQPGASELPDLFVAYPRVAEQIGCEKLLNWSEYFSEEELASYVPGFLSEGYFDEDLLMLPIAKSTELLFLNQTSFDSFSADTGVKADALTDFASLFDASNAYYDWSEGTTMFQINDFYHYFLTAVTSMGGDLIVDGAIDAESEAFEAAYMPMAKAAIHGGLCVGDGYASDRWKTGEVISNIGSTAGILYLRDYVTYPDNTTLNIDITVAPYPTFSGAAPMVIQRGGGLFSVKHEDERMNKAAVVFAKWVTTGQANLDFATRSGYLPVVEDAFQQLFADPDMVENDMYRMLYETVADMYGHYSFCSLPVYESAGTVQSGFEVLMKSELSAAHEEYVRRVEGGEDSGKVLEELTASSLDEIRKAVCGG